MDEKTLPAADGRGLSEGLGPEFEAWWNDPPDDGPKPEGPVSKATGAWIWGAAVAAERERRAHLAGELQSLRDHVAYWSRAGIDGDALARADAALREWA
jgi:hypothetical protein